MSQSSEIRNPVSDLTRSGNGDRPARRRRSHDHDRRQRGGGGTGNVLTLATGGTLNGGFRVLGQANLMFPLINREAPATNPFDNSGVLRITNVVHPAELQRFVLIVQP